MEQKDYILVRQFKYIVFFCFRKANSSLCYNAGKLILSGTKYPASILGVGFVLPVDEW